MLDQIKRMSIEDAFIRMEECAQRAGRSARPLERNYLRIEVERLIEHVDGDVERFAALKEHERDLLLDGLASEYGSYRELLEKNQWLDGTPLDDDQRQTLDTEEYAAARAIALITKKGRPV